MGEADCALALDCLHIGELAEGERGNEQDRTHPGVEQRIGVMDQIPCKIQFDRRTGLGLCLCTVLDGGAECMVPGEELGPAVRLQPLCCRFLLIFRQKLHLPMRLLKSHSLRDMLRVQVPTRREV